MIVFQTAQPLIPKIIFHNTHQENLTFEEMFLRILQFIQDDPGSPYRIAIGTDSQVRGKTYFVTAVLLHRVGKGAVGFLKEVVIPRNIRSLREKISLEIALTQEVAYMFTPEHINLIYETILSEGYSPDQLDLEIHLDIGVKGPTKELIKEMVNRVSGLGFSVKIKPFAVAASSLANRYTK